MKRIQSRDNPFFKGLKRLAESGRERRKTGQTLLDGVHLVEAYEAAHGAVMMTPYDADFERQMDAARKIMKNRRQVLRELAK